jgi:two-component system sensor histidine kinase MprB
MSLRRRLALVAAATVGVAAVLVAIVSYVAVAHELRSEVDDGLRRQAALIVENQFFPRPGVPIPAPPPREGESAAYVQVVAPDGDVTPLRGPSLPADAVARVIAASGRGEVVRDLRVAGTHLRVLTFGLPGGGALELGRSLEQVDNVVARLRLVLLLVSGGGIALAALLGALASRSLIAPLAKVTEAARHIGATEDLARRIDVRTNDEVGELARRFNAMLDTLAASRAALDDSMRAQRQLVADASHELRTPITSLRTNLEVLMDEGRLGADERRRLLRDVIAQVEELGALVGDLIELARGDEPAAAVVEEVRLDHLVAEALERARLHAPDVAFNVSLQPVVVEGAPDRLARAIANLLDNAAKHTRPGTQVDVSVDATGLTVRDHGDGIAPEDLPSIFDRFYRGAAARGRAGSGLGLAIVRQVAQTHGGRVSADNAPDGGAVFRLELPAAAIPAARPAPAPG